MNFAQMLATPVRPLPEVSGKRTVGKGRHKNHNTDEANKAKHSKSLARYRKVMGSEWVPTRRIEERVGVAYRSSSATLVRWLQMGLLERRPVGECYARQRGWEWRFME